MSMALKCEQVRCLDATKYTLIGKILIGLVQRHVTRKGVFSVCAVS